MNHLEWTEIAKNIVFGHKATSERYIAWLRKQGVQIGRDVRFHTPWSIKIDTQHPWMITIGNNVNITADCSILQHDWSWLVVQQTTGVLYGSCAKVIIGNNVFIGQKTLILQGAQIGDNTIIGGGSVVTGKLEGNAVYAGVPTRKLCDLDTFVQKLKDRQLPEAVSLVNEHKRVYGTWPPKQALREFFWLFEPRSGSIDPVFKNMNNRFGNARTVETIFKNLPPLFNGYHEFLKYAQTQSNSAERYATDCKDYER